MKYIVLIVLLMSGCATTQPYTNKKATQLVVGSSEMPEVTTMIGTPQYRYTGTGRQIASKVDKLTYSKAGSKLFAFDPDSEFTYWHYKNKERRGSSSVGGALLVGLLNPVWGAVVLADAAAKKAMENTDEIYMLFDKDGILIGMFDEKWGRIK